MRVQKTAFYLFVAWLLCACGQKPPPTTPVSTIKADTIYAETDTTEAEDTLKKEIQKTLFEKFLPDGYTLLQEARGDINQDGFEDAVLVLKSIEADSLWSDAARPLLLLVGDDGGNFKISARNDSVVLCCGCGGVFGDPFEGISINDNYFSVEHYGGSSWRWARKAVFRYDARLNDWFLYKTEGISYHTSNPDSTTQTVNTADDFGQISFHTYRY